MMLYTLRFASELRDAKDYWNGKADVAVDRSQLALAKQLTDSFTRPFEAAEYHDQYEEALRELVEAKIHHQAPPEHEPVRKTGKVIDLMEALQKSLAQKKKLAGEEESADAGKAGKKAVASARKGTAKRKSKSA
jgi:DNA end-binding protein Ku